MRLIRWMAVMLVAAVALTGCEGLFSFESPCDVPQDAAAFSELYEPWLNVPLPASAHHFAARCSRWMDHHEFWLQFDITPDDLATLQTDLTQAWGAGRLIWQANAPLTDAQQSRMRRIVTERMIERMRSYVVGFDKHLDNLITVVDTSNPNAYRVFLYVFRSF